MRSFSFRAKADDVPRFARQIVDALGEGFDQTLIMAGISEALLNAIAYGALGLPASSRDRDPVEFVEMLREAEARTGPKVGIAVVVTTASDEPEDKLVTITDPGKGFDWRAKVNSLADKSVRPSLDEMLDTSGRGISIILAAARGVLWNEAGNEITLRFRSPKSPPPNSKPPPPIRIRVATDDRVVSPTAATLEGIPALRLPAKAPPKPSGGPPSSPKDPRPQFQSGTTEARVLVVDDIEVNRRVLQHMLNWEGFDVRLASDGPTALALMESWVPNIMVLDLNMPKMNGIEVIHAMRDRKLLRQTSVLLLTAAAVDAQTRSEALDAGACDFLEKPISRRELIARIQRRLAMQQELRKMSQERHRIEGSVVAAAEVMRALMPEPRIHVEGACISTLVVPCDAVGGDVVDFVKLDPARWMVSLIDVAGHGLAAALTASAARAILRDRLISGRSLSDAVTALNARLSEDFDRTGQQVAVVAMVVDQRHRTAEVLNAGCPPALALRPPRTWERVKSSAPPAGLLPDTTFSTTLFPLDGLARVIFVSDGLTEGFARSSDSMGALTHILGANALERETEVPVERVRAAIRSLGPTRDDASIAWIEFC